MMNGFNVYVGDEVVASFPSFDAAVDYAKSVKLADYFICTAKMKAELDALKMVAA